MRPARLAVAAMLMAATMLATTGSAAGEHRGGRWERYELEQGLRRLEEIEQRRLEIEEDRDREERRQRRRLEDRLEERWPTGPLDLDRCRTDRGYVECQR